MKKIKNTLSAILIFAILATGVGGVLAVKNYVSPSYTDINTTLKGVDTVGNIVEGNEIDSVVKNELLFLLIGVDAERFNDNVKNGKRSDTMMLCKVNTETGKIDIMSLPRDSRVPVKGNLDKLNHSHAYGGTKLVMQTVRDFTGLDIDYYVKVDYGLVKEVVDTVGGVNINVPFDMKYDDPSAEPPLHIDLKQGDQVLDGDKAIQFLRWRHNNPGMATPGDGGDIGRVERQQYFMKELAKKSMDTRNLFKLIKLAESAYNNIDTNIDLITIAQMSKSVKDIDLNNINTITIPGEPQTIKGKSYYIINKGGLQDIINVNYSKYKEYDVKLD